MVVFGQTALSARYANSAIKLDFEPNFNIGFNHIFPADGCYLCLLVRAKGIFVFTFSTRLFISDIVII